MDNPRGMIDQFIFSPGKSGSEIASFLKEYGGGSEQRGLKCLAEYYLKEGNIGGEKSGILKGSVGTLVIIVGASLIKEAHRRYKDREEQIDASQRILQAIQECKEEDDVEQGKNGCTEQPQNVSCTGTED